MLFSDVVGQDALKEQLRKSVLSDRIAHTQLFRGRKGSGDLLLALAYSKYVLCNDRNALEACGKCTSCLSMDKLEHPDLHFTFPTRYEKDKLESHHFVSPWREFVLRNPYSDFQEWSDVHAPNKNIEVRVKEASAVAKKLSLKSYLGGYKIVLIWNADKVNRDASNKLLKAIEEPPEKTLFLLLTTDPERLLPTILSRTQQHYLAPVDTSAIENYLVKDHACATSQAKDIAMRSEGDVLEAQNLLDADSDSMLPLFREWMLSCYYNKASDTKSACDGFQSLGREGQKRFIRYGIQKIRQCVLYDQGLDELVHAVEEERDFLQKFKVFVKIDTAEWFREEFERMHYELDRNANAKIMFMDTSYQLYSRLRN